MKASSFLFMLIVCFFLPQASLAASGYYEECYYETGDKIAVTVSAHVAKDEKQEFSYYYAIKSAPDSMQNIWLFKIILPEKGIVNGASSPAMWGGPGWSGKPTRFGTIPIAKPPYAISWTAPAGNMKPATTINGFMFQTSYGFIGIVDFYAEGENIARCPEGMAVDFIPGYHDLTPYGPGIVGKTLGPTAPPADFKPVDFLDNIINMKHEAFSLGWITNKGIEQSLDAKLENAKKKLEQGNGNAAKNILSAFINEVEAQGCETYEGCPEGKHLTPEAYALLKYNVKHLIEHIK